MSPKKLLVSFSLCLFYSLSMFSLTSIKNNPRDTITLNEENTKKVIELGNKIEAAINDNQADVFTSKFYKNVFIKRVMDLNQQLDYSDPNVTEFVTGMKKGLSSFPNELIKEVQNGAYYNFINYRYDEDKQTYYLLFRLFSSETGLNYHDFRIHKKETEMQFSDMYVYITGENLSDTMSRIMAYTVPKKKILGFIKTSEDEGIEQLNIAIRYKKAGNFKLAYTILDGITSKLSKDKFFMIFKSTIASHVDDEKYLKALEELITTHPNDPTINLNKIDYLIFKGEYFEAIQVIDQLQYDTDDDFLNFMKAQTALEDENYDFALNNYKYIIDNYTNFFEGQMGYLTTLSLMKNYTEATTYIDILIADGYDKTELIQYIEEDDEFGENIFIPLMESKAYQKWKRKNNQE